MKSCLTWFPDSKRLPKEGNENQFTDYRVKPQKKLTDYRLKAAKIRGD
jgi:hypothetical protein